MAIDAAALTLDTTAYLPAAPNIAVINDASYPEVVHYTTKDATTLGGLTRGLSLNGAIGAAHAHDAGVEVYSGDTAYAKAAEIENVEYLFAQQAIGVEWDRTADDTTALTLIDIDGNPVTSLPFGSFDNHRTYREIRRCILSRTGTPTYGANARGDELTLDGSAGRVMVSIPKFWCKADNPEPGKYRWWISPFPISGFEVHPAFRQRGGVEREMIYVGAYNANLHYRTFPTHDDWVFALHSRTGEQPVTGDGSYTTLPFVSGGPAMFRLGETLTGATSGETGVVVDVYVSSGLFASGDAAGVYLLRQVSGEFDSGESLNGSVSGADVSTTASAGADVSFTARAARGYAENVGPGWGLVNIWTWSAVVLLALIEHQSFDFQGALGRGVVDLAEGTGFAGKLNGADSADTNIGANGTGTGTGDNGETPVVWRGIENLYGNVETFVDGICSYKTEGTVRLTPRAGTAPVTTPTASAEITSGTVPHNTLAVGFIDDLLFEPLARLLFLPSSTDGAAGTYLCDAFMPVNDAPGVMMNGGFVGWYGGDYAGPFAGNFFYSDADDVPKTTGARIEYIGPEGGTPAVETVTPGGGGDPVVVPARTRVTTPSPVVAGVDPSTPAPVATNPSTANSDPPIQIIPVQTPGQIITGDGGVTTAFNTGYGWGIDGAGTSWQLAFSGGYFMTNMSSQWPVWTERYDGDTVAQVFGVTPLTSIGYWVSRGETSMYGPSNWTSQGIPPGATVTGITVKRYGRYSGEAPAIGTDLVMKVCVHDQAGTKHESTNKAVLNTNWGYGPHNNNDQTKYLRVYGGPTDLWGLDPSVLTPENLNARGIEVDFQLESRAGAGGTGTPGRFYLYAIFVEITFEV